MVGTFISKYLLVTTSTITVTSSAAVTFFVAKHLKIGKGYEQMLDYMKQRYCAVVNDKSAINQDIIRINANIDLALIEIIKGSKNLFSDSKEVDSKKYYENIKNELDRLVSSNSEYLSTIKDSEKRLKLDADYRRLQRILEEYVDSSLECSNTYF